MFEYKVVYGKDTETLESEVKDLRNRGWTLAGGVAVVPKAGRSLLDSAYDYFQAMERDNRKSKA